MKRTKILFMITLLLCFTLMSGCGSKKESAQQKDSSLTGVVTDVAMSTISIKTKNGHTYLFSKEDATVLSPDGGAAPKQKATVYYSGSLDSKKEVQSVKIRKIVLVAADTEKKDKKVTTIAVESTTELVNEVPDTSDKSDALASSLSLEDKVAQMFWVRCPATDAATIQKEYQFGGYILFDRDFDQKDQTTVTNNIQSYQANSAIPMLIGVDEEGGTVCRVSNHPTFRNTRFWAPRKLFKSGGLELIRSNEKERALLLQSLGINVNLAPVCDIATNKKDYMYPRSFGQNGQGTSQYVETVVDESQKYGVGTVLKHFPGYGNNVNTHTGIATDKRSYSTFTGNDFLPFEGGIKAGAGCILVSHNIVNCMDNKHPASLSPKVHDILRNELKFDGVIMTDDLSMKAITTYTDGKAAAVQAVLAGNDLLCVDDYKTQYKAVLKAVKKGIISEDQITASTTRILKWKAKLGLLK